MYLTYYSTYYIVRAYLTQEENKHDKDNETSQLRRLDTSIQSR